MDLGAYSQIDSLKKIMADNGIVVPRLRGLRLMSQEKMISKDDIYKSVMSLALNECERLLNPWSFEISKSQQKYLKYDADQYTPIEIRWDRVHGKKRKMFKYVVKDANRRINEQLELFNSYCGNPDILYIHARIGGGNWPYYSKEVKDQPWFICKIDDAFDSTYCDIYARISPPEEKSNA